MVHLALLVLASPLPAQQVADSAFAFPNPNPAFEAGTGPRVCVDAAHHNFHTLDGRYYAFGKLIRGDGFRSVSNTEPFGAASLADCAVLVIANALAAENAVVEGDPEGTRGRWGFPHPSAFTGEEISALLSWVEEGGGLLLITDHAPFPGAAADLAALLGAVPLDGGTTYRVFGELDEEALGEVAEEAGLTVERLREAVGTVGVLGDHPILRGRQGMDPPVQSIMTFGGSAFLPSEEMEPLLRVAPDAYGLVSAEGLPRESWPRYPMVGWLAGGARDYGEGRVVVLGEAAQCTAQRAGPDRHPMGMNHPMSIDKPRFCLNAVRWLAGVL